MTNVRYHSTISALARVALVLGALALAGCNGTLEDIAPANPNVPLPAKVVQSLKAKDMSLNSPIMMRIFKEEGKLEVWKQKQNGRYGLAASYDICQWSGKLGPKFTEGDRQAPEGFYTIRPGQMNPNSDYYLSFNIGYPNAFDRAHGRTGSNLMVHGACSSAGCYSMTDQQVAEIWAFARDAFRGGQREFQVQALPFRMTPANMARYKDDPNFGFWKNLKEGYDYFEITHVPPKVDVCDSHYVFNQIAEDESAFSPTRACPATSQPDSLQTAYRSYQASYEAAFASAVNKDGIAAPKPSIAGFKEATLVADWSRRRARGEKVSRTPPSLNPTTPATVAVVPRPAPEAVAESEPVKENPSTASVAAPAAAPADASAATQEPQTAEADAGGKPSEKKGIRKLWGLFGG